MNLNDQIKEIAITLRKLHKLKLPDALIAASAFYYNIPLISADKDFTIISELDVIFYQPG